MRARAISLLAVMIVAAAAGAAAAGPSFDCHTNRSPSELAICDNPELGLLDTEMANLYFQVSNDSSGRYYRRVKQDQRAWLAEREHCGANVRCLTATYQARIQELREERGPLD